MRIPGNIEERSEVLQRDKTFENLFRLTCDYGERIAARYLSGDEEKSISFVEYEELSYAYGARLREIIGLNKKGGFVAIQMDTCPEWFPVFWGCIAAGYNAILLDFNLSDAATDYMLRQAGAVAIISNKRRLLHDDIQQIPAQELFAAKKAHDFTPSFACHVALCTSGTTDTSRIYVYDQRAVCEQVLNSVLLYKENKRIIADEPLRSLAFLPYHHVFGFMVCLLWIHFIGYESIYLKDRSPKTIQETAQRFHVNHLMAVPILANNLSNGLQKKVAQQNRYKQIGFKLLRSSSLALQTLAPSMGIDFARKYLFRSVDNRLLGTDIRCIILGGSHTPVRHMRTLSALGYYTVAGFGMTETAITSVETSNNIVRRTSGSVGRPFTTVEYKVIPDGKRKNRGEMLIRGSSLHTGRLVDGKLLPPFLDEEGWYHTGDVVRLGKSGRMYVEGRCKDVIINESGENVYPDEIEDVFSALENVDQFCVLGLRPIEKTRKISVFKDKSTGYEDIALVLSVGAHFTDESYLEALARSIRQINLRLPAIKRVTRVIVTNQPFAVVNGIKVKRLALKKSLEEGSIKTRDLSLNTQADETLEHRQSDEAENKMNSTKFEDIKKQVRHVFALALEIEENQLTDTAHFIDDLGGDSLQVLGMALKIEEEFSVIIPTEEYGRCTTINDLSRLLYEKLTGEHDEKDLPDEQVTPICRFEDTPEYHAFKKRQDELIGSGENPYFVCHDSPLTDTSVMAGERVLNFGSYNYVGMSGRKETMEAAKAAIDKFGTSASGSRLLAGEKTLYQELEAEIASWKHTETALVLVGGHSTNVTCVGNFCGKKDLIVYDAIAHNSIEQGCRLSQATAKPFPHNDTTALESILRTHRNKFEKVLIVIEGAYSMDGDIAPVPEIVRLKKKYGCFLMVDEAHSTCVIGRTGGGVDEYFALSPNDIDIKMGTLSKGLGTCGGYLAGSHAIIDYMRYNLPGFVFSVGISPPLAAATLCAIRLLRSDPSIMDNLRRNIECFIQEAHKRNMNTCLAGKTAIVPVLIGKDEDAFLLSNMMRKKGVFVPPAVYPAVPKNKARLRFCVTSEHKPEQIVQALDVLKECAHEAGLKLPDAF